MHILSPEDRVLLWQKTIGSAARERQVMVKLLAREALDSVGSRFDLYHGYEDAFVESFELLDASGFIGRDDLRIAFEEADRDREAAAALLSLLAEYLDEAGHLPRLGVASQGRCLALAGEWRESLVERPADEVGEWLSVPEVAARFGVSRQAVYKWIHSGKIESEPRPGGGSFRIPAAQFSDRRTDLRRLAELQRRLLGRHGESEPSDEALVDELRSRRR
jgi:excisionase family DNA binding protein